MRLVLFILLFTVGLASPAQFSKHVDDDGNVTYIEDPDYDDVQNEFDGSQTQDDMPAIQEYLRQRDAARKQQQAKRGTKNSIGLNRGRVDLNRRLNYRKCRDLRRWGLKCY